jgi:sugar phosphate permease
VTTQPLRPHQFRFLPKRIFFGWYIVGATLIITTFVSGFFNYGMSALVIPMEESLGTNREVISTAIGVAPIESAVLGPFLGMFIDRLGARRIMLAGVLLHTLGFILIGHAHSVPQFVFYFIVLAIGNGMIVAPSLATIGNWFIKRRGLAYAIGPMGFGFGGAVTPLVAFLVREVGWRDSTWICGLIVLCITLPLVPAFRYRPEPYGLYPDGDTKPASYAPGKQLTASTEINFTVKEALATKAFWLINMNFAMRTAVVGALATQFVPAMVSKGFSATTGASILALLGVFMIPGRFGIGYLADKYDKRHVTAGVSMVMALCMVGFFFAQSYWVILLVFAVYASANGGGGSAAFAVRGEYFGRASIATLAGFGNILQSTGSFLGNRLSGTIYVHTGSYGPAFILFACISVVGAAFILLARRPIPNRLRSQA